MTEKRIGVVGFDEDGVEESVGSLEVKKAKKSKKGGGFQSMGLSYPILKAVLKRGYKVPTPVQRKTIPVALEGKDIVSMARTGSGKTACFLLPMLERLKERNGSGIRGLILSPTRELAIQTLKFTKELGKFTTLKVALVLGGDPMESQFSSIHSNPDIVIATPGRFLHLCVEMGLKLNTIEYVVFDEADRLFEMGFSEQLTEIMQRLPETRQTMLFSATLPKALVQFAKAGLNDPVLIRLDVETKIPDTLELAFFLCRPEEREAALLCILKHIVKDDSQTVVFAATKHHVEFLHMMLEHAGISNTYIYSDLDASARKINAAKFQTKKVDVLIVTDVAARGIDIPHLDNVVNYNFPAKPKLFVHRVGRCARAGRSGKAFSLVTTDELCYVLDLHLFLARSLSIATPQNEKNLKGDGHFGKIPQSLVEEELAEIINWSNTCSDVEPMRKVCNNGYKNYIKSRPGASMDSVRRAKNLDLRSMGMHPLFLSVFAQESERLNFISKIKSYRPNMTVFEMGQSANSESSLSMRLFRKVSRNSIETHYKRKENAEQSVGSAVKEDHFIPYKPADDHTEQGLAVGNLKNSSEAVLELVGDTEEMMRNQKRVEKRWDPTKRKYVAQNNREKMIKSESGQWIPVSYKTDRYERWQEKNKIQANYDHDNDDDDDTNGDALPSIFKKGSLRADTHWGRHNMKLSEKQYKPLAVDTKHILKQRLLKEKRRKRNGRKPNSKKKDKQKMKSKKFNKT